MFELDLSSLPRDESERLIGAAENRPGQWKPVTTYRRENRAIRGFPQSTALPSYGCDRRVNKMQWDFLEDNPIIRLLSF